MLSITSIMSRFLRERNSNCFVLFFTGTTQTGKVRVLFQIEKIKKNAIPSFVNLSQKDLCSKCVCKKRVISLSCLETTAERLWLWLLQNAFKRLKRRVALTLGRLAGRPYIVTIWTQLGIGCHWQEYSTKVAC